MTDSEKLDLLVAEMRGMKQDIAGVKQDMTDIKQDLTSVKQELTEVEYSCAMKSHFRKSGYQMSGKWKSSYASLLA